MIIGENINSEYYGYEEENYDYLFKRKTKEERQQKKAEKKEKRAEKKQVRQEKRTEKKLTKQDPATGGKKKLQIFGNFGLFDKNKNKKKTTGTAATPGASAKTGELASSPESSSTDESKLTPEAKAAAAEAGAASTSTDKTDSGTPSGNEAAGGGNEKNEDKGGKKEAGMGAVFGFIALGLVVTVVGVVLFKSNIKPEPATQPLRAAA